MFGLRNMHKYNKQHFVYNLLMYKTIKFTPLTIMNLDDDL